MSNIEFILTFVGLLLTIAGGYVALRLRPLEDADFSSDKRITALHTDMKEDRDKFERRLGDVEKSFISRTELTAAIKEIHDCIDKSTDRVESIVRALGAKVDHLAERVVKVETES